MDPNSVSDSFTVLEELKLECRILVQHYSSVLAAFGPHSNIQ